LSGAWQAQQDAEDHVATGPDLRIGDADRGAAAASLREHYALGRLTLQEFNHRLDAVFAASTQRQLRALTGDLPDLAAPPASLPLTPAGARRERGRQQSWPGFRARLGMIPVIIAALAAWLLISGLQWRLFPWPGRLAVFLVIFAALRWLLRRVWHVGRSHGRYPGGW
jgi:hypothetical protein